MERLDTSYLLLPCATHGAESHRPCYQGVACDGRVKATLALDFELAVDLLPGGMRTCGAWVAVAVRGRHKVLCEECVPWLRGSCPHCGAPTAEVTMSYPLRLRVVTALADELRGPTGVPVAGGVLHHMGAWALRALRCYLRLRVEMPAFAARVKVRRLQLPAMASPLFDVVDVAVDEAAQSLRKRPGHVKPDPVTVRNAPVTEAGICHALFGAPSLPSVFESVHVMPT